MVIPSEKTDGYVSLLLLSSKESECNIKMKEIIRN